MSGHLVLALCAPMLRSESRLVAKHLTQNSRSSWELKSARLAAHETHRFASIPVAGGKALRVYLSASAGSSIALTLFDHRDNLISERNGGDHYDFYVLPDEDSRYCAVIVSENSSSVSYSFSVSIPVRLPTQQDNTAATSPLFASVKVFYATDRSPTRSKSITNSFGGEMNPAGVVFGTSAL